MHAWKEKKSEKSRLKNNDGKPPIHLPLAVVAYSMEQTIDQYCRTFYVLVWNLIWNWFEKSVLLISNEHDKKNDPNLISIPINLKSFINYLTTRYIPWTTTKKYHSFYLILFFWGANLTNWKMKSQSKARASLKVIVASNHWNVSYWWMVWHDLESNGKLTVAVIKWHVHHVRNVMRLHVRSKAETLHGTKW